MEQTAEKKLTIKQHVNLIARGYKLFSTFPKPVLFSRFICSLAQVGTPFLNLYLSSCIIKELAGARNGEKLWFLVGVTVLSNLVMGIMVKLIIRWTDYCDCLTYFTMYQIYTDKLLAMDYLDIENPNVQQQYSNIMQHQKGMGFGLPRLISPLQEMIYAVIQIVLSATVSISLFTNYVPVGSGLEFLNHPLTVAAVGIVLIGATLLSPYLTVIGEKIWSKVSSSSNKATRVFQFYFFYFNQSYRQGKRYTNL